MNSLPRIPSSFNGRCGRGLLGVFVAVPASLITKGVLACCLTAKRTSLPDPADAPHAE
jgi:hypothetical protein